MGKVDLVRFRDVDGTLLEAWASQKSFQKKDGGGRFPPTVHPAPEDEALVDRRWSEYGWE